MENYQFLNGGKIATGVNEDGQPLKDDEVSPEMKEYVADMEKAKKEGKLVHDPCSGRHVIIR